MKADDILEKVRSLAIEHTKYRGSCINLIAAENVTSLCVREIVASDLMHRCSLLLENQVDRRKGPASGTGLSASYFIEIEKILVHLAKKIFAVKFVEFRPLGGQTAIMPTISALTQPGDTVFEIGKENGGHGWSLHNPAHYRPCFYPFNPEEWNIDIDAAVKKITETKPRVLITGSSFYLFPHPVRDLKEAAEEVGAMVVADEAHTLALIAGKQWPNPMFEGADVLCGSTHKSWPGPVKGLTLTNDEEIATKIGNYTYPGYVVTDHHNETAALVVSLAELQEFGEAYATQGIKNAKALAEALAVEGLKVIGEGKGFTQSHQVLTDTLKYMSGAEATERLERANIIVNIAKLVALDGLRIGVSEVTRLGMRESGMKYLAELIRKVVIDKQNPEHIASEAKDFMRNFQNLHYSFNAGQRAYKYFKFW